MSHKPFMAMYLLSLTWQCWGLWLCWPYLEVFNLRFGTRCVLYVSLKAPSVRKRHTLGAFKRLQVWDRFQRHSQTQPLRFCLKTIGCFLRWVSHWCCRSQTGSLALLGVRQKVSWQQNDENAFHKRHNLPIWLAFLVQAFSWVCHAKAVIPRDMSLYKAHHHKA